MKQITFTDRLRYQFDNTMSKGTIALIGWLFIISVHPDCDYLADCACHRHRPDPGRW